MTPPLPAVPPLPPLLRVPGSESPPPHANIRPNTATNPIESQLRMTSSPNKKPTMAIFYNAVVRRANRHADLARMIDHRFHVLSVSQYESPTPILAQRAETARNQRSAGCQAPASVECSARFFLSERGQKPFGNNRGPQIRLAALRPGIHGPRVPSLWSTADAVRWCTGDANIFRSSKR